MTRSRGKPSARIGRRPSTTKEELAAIGIELFMEAGFDETSIDDIAEEADIARRTFFRYFPSKNEVAWGNFDEHLAGMRASLETIPEDVPLSEALTTALHDFNTFPDSEAERHRARMGLILHTPALQGYSSVMYQAGDVSSPSSSPVASGPIPTTTSPAPSAICCSVSRSPPTRRGSTNPDRICTTYWPPGWGH